MLLVRGDGSSPLSRLPSADSSARSVETTPLRRTLFNASNRARTLRTARTPTRRAGPYKGWEEGPAVRQRAGDRSFASTPTFLDFSSPSSTAWSPTRPAAATCTGESKNSMATPRTGRSCHCYASPSRQSGPGIEAPIATGHRAVVDVRLDGWLLVAWRRRSPVAAVRCRVYAATEESCRCDDGEGGGSPAHSRCS
jgi:hypothetical protein